MKRIPIIVSIALAFGLAACSDQGGGGTKTQEPAAESKAPEAKSAVESKAPEAKPAAPAEKSARSQSGDTESVTNAACLAAVSKETGEKDVSVLSNEFSEANTLVMIAVGANRAPWKCLVSNDGQVQEVSFTGTDGDDPAEPAKTEAAPAGGVDVSQAAIDACLAAVQNQTKEPDQAVLSSEFSEANSMVMIGVGADRAPWKCLVSNDGQVQEVSFTGSEGAQ
jgi:hypothetical protein